MLKSDKLFRVIFALVCILLASAGVSIDTEKLFDGEKVFKKIVAMVAPQTIANSRHAYHTMYGRFLVPMVEKFKFRKAHFKFLEIGVGCGASNYSSPGLSLQIWKKLLVDVKAEVWQADQNSTCVESALKVGKLDGSNILLGDQGNETTLAQWVHESGGKFDVVVDDGGHHSFQVIRTLKAFWPELNPGGYYFIEDMEYGFTEPFKTAGFPAVSKLLQSWMEHLSTSDLPHYYRDRPKKVSSKERSPHHYKLLNAHPVPEGLDFIFCQASGCVLHKKSS